MHIKDSPQDWSDIRLFLAIHQHGNLIAAAEHLDLTQPTMGRRLAAMEKRYGTPLFVRTGRRMQLTDAGMGILESAYRIEREMLAIERSIEAQSKGYCGEVVISATEGTGIEWLTPVLRDFHRQYPKIVLRVLIENRAVDIVRREADIALRLGQPAQEDVIAKHLVTVGFGLYASQSYLDQAPPLDSPEDLSAHQLVRLDSNKNANYPRSSFLSAPSVAENCVYYSNSPAAQLSAVQAGFGIGVLSHRWSSQVKGLVRVLPEHNAESLNLWLVTHEDLRYSARIRALFDFIAERAQADKVLFEYGSEG